MSVSIRGKSRLQPWSMNSWPNFDRFQIRIARVVFLVVFCLSLRCPKLRSCVYLFSPCFSHLWSSMLYMGSKEKSKSETTWWCVKVCGARQHVPQGPERTVCSSYLKRHGCQTESLVTWKRKHHSHFLRKGERNTHGTTGQWVSPLYPERNHPGCYVKSYARQGDDLRQPALLHHGQIVSEQSGSLL